VSDGTPPPPGGENYPTTPPPPSQAGGGYQPPPPPPPGYGGAPAYGQQPPYGPPKNNGKALWALILGIIGLVCCGIFTGVPAIILGKMGQNEVDASNGTQKGRGMATAGFVLGIIAVVWGVIWLILAATGNLNFNFSTS
jgi:hypothetical protein